LGKPLQVHDDKQQLKDHLPLFTFVIFSVQASTKPSTTQSTPLEKLISKAVAVSPFFILASSCVMVLELTASHNASLFASYLFHPIFSNQIEFIKLI